MKSCRARGASVTGSTLLKDITQSAVEAMHSGKAMDPDVLP